MDRQTDRQTAESNIKMFLWWCWGPQQLHFSPIDQTFVSMSIRRTQRFRFCHEDHDQPQMDSTSSDATTNSGDRRDLEAQLEARLEVLRKELMEKSQIQLEQSYDTCAKVYDTMPVEAAMQLAAGVRLCTMTVMEKLEGEHAMQIFFNPDALLRLQRELYNDSLSRIINETYAFVVQSRLMKEASDKLAKERADAAGPSNPPAL